MSDPIRRIITECVKCEPLGPIVINDPTMGKETIRWETPVRWGYVIKNYPNLYKDAGSPKVDDDLGFVTLVTEADIPYEYGARIDEARIMNMGDKTLHMVDPCCDKLDIMAAHGDVTGMFNFCPWCGKRIRHTKSDRNLISDSRMRELLTYEKMVTDGDEDEVQDSDN